MHAPAALAYLVAATFRNRLRLQLARLRRPRHLVPVAAGALYFGWVLFGQRGEGREVVADALATPSAERLIALLVAIRAATWWLFGSDRSALAFSPAEVHFLFPAPVARRDLLQFRILSVQLRVLLSVVLLAVLTRRGPSTGVAVLRAVGIWTLLSTVHLHRLGAALARAGAVEHGRAALRRNLLPLALAGAAMATIGWAVVGALRGPAFAVDPVGALVAALDAPAAAAALLPFRMIVRPLFAVEPAAWLRAIAPATLVLALHYLWVLRSGVAFEDTAVAASAEAAARAAARRTSGGRALPATRRARAGGWLPLAPAGPPAVALVWKNVLAAFRTLPLTPLVGVLLVAVPLALVLTEGAPDGRAAAVLRALALAWAGGLVVVGPQLVRTDLRQDLARLPVLRTYPLSGRHVVLAEVGAAAAVLTALAAPAIVVAYLAGTSVGVDGELRGVRAPHAVAALVALPVLAALALAIQNAAALLFPNWVRLGAGPRPGGLESSGQNLVLLLASATLLALLVAPAAAVGVGVGWALDGWLGHWAAVPASLAGTLGGAGELWLVAGWLGRVFERTEPAEVA